jgi:hypothetical protein
MCGPVAAKSLRQRGGGDTEAGLVPAARGRDRERRPGRPGSTRPDAREGTHAAYSTQSTHEDRVWCQFHVPVSSRGRCAAHTRVSALSDR